MGEDKGWPEEAKLICSACTRAGDNPPPSTFKKVKWYHAYRGPCDHILNFMSPTTLRTFIVP